MAAALAVLLFIFIVLLILFLILLFLLLLLFFDLDTRLTELLVDLQPGLVGQAQVEQNDVGRLPGHQENLSAAILLVSGGALPSGAGYNAGVSSAHPVGLAKRRQRPVTGTASRSVAMSAPVHKQVRLAGAVIDRKRHVCAFFNSKEEKYRVLMPFIKEGFDQGDRALHFIDPRNRAEHLRRLEQAGIAVAEAERKGQLEIRPWEDAPLQEGHFDQHRQIALIDRLLNSRRASGYPLTRLVGNMEWALEDKPGVNDLVEFESRVNYTLDRHEDAICCAYDVSRFSASVIMDALRVHPAVIIGGIYQENPFYVPPDEFLNELRERNASRSAPAR